MSKKLKRPKSKGFARYQCDSCRVVFDDKPGPVTCPRCPSRYITWLNYEDLRERCGWSGSAKAERLRLIRQTLRLIRQALGSRRSAVTSS